LIIPLNSFDHSTKSWLRVTAELSMPNPPALVGKRSPSNIMRDNEHDHRHDDQQYSGLGQGEINKPIFWGFPAHEPNIQGCQCFSLDAGQETQVRSLALNQCDQRFQLVASYKLRCWPRTDEMAALAKCPSCNNEVSREAKACPQCGQPLSFRSPARGTIFLIIAGLIGGWWLVHNTSDEATKSSNAKPADPCNSDWSKCADNSQMANNFKEWSRGKVACKYAANEKARYGTPVWPWLAFSSFYPGTNYVTSGIAVLIERDAQFQNGFGAMVHSRVECTYDLRAEKVTDVIISER
jgi:hypothetical protein